MADLACQALNATGRPGLHAGRLDFERNEKVMPQAPPSAVEAKTWVQETVSLHALIGMTDPDKRARVQNDTSYRI